MLPIRLDGKRALVCGASHGIGRAIALELASLGAQVIALARRESVLQGLVRELGAGGHRYLAADLEDLPNLHHKLSEVITAGGPIEILIANSAGPKGGPLLQAEDAAYLQAFTSHLLANTALVKALLPGMLARDYGRIIHITSTSVKVPIRGLGVSNTIRGAVASWAKTLSVEIGHPGITVNNVLPGYTETPRLEALVGAAAQKRACSDREIEAEWKKSVPLGRFASPAEIAYVVAFLSSPAAAYVNGVALPVDGGRTGSL